MTDTLTTNSPTEACSVNTNDVSGQLTGAEAGRAFAGHGSVREMDESRYAAAQLEQYACIDADGRWIPEYVLTMDQWAADMAERTGRNVDDAAFKIARSIIDERLTRNDSACLGAVSLDVNPEQPGRPQDLGHPDQPAVVFLEIRPGSALYADDRRAMAVWFQPEVDELGYAVNPRTGKNGRHYADDTFIGGYGGIVEYYVSLSAADEAMRELRKAVKILATPSVADTDDKITSVYDEEVLDPETGRYVQVAPKRQVKRDAPAF